MTLPSIATTAAAPFHLDEPLRWLPAPPLDDPPASAPQLDLIHSIVTGLHNDTGISGRGKSWRRASIISFTTCTDHSKAEQQVRVVSLITWMKGRIWVWVHLPAPGICSRSRVSIKIWDRWLRCCPSFSPLSFFAAVAVAAAAAASSNPHDKFVEGSARGASPFQVR